LAAIRICPLAATKKALWPSVRGRVAVAARYPGWARQGPACGRRRYPPSPRGEPAASGCA